MFAADAKGVYTTDISQKVCIAMQELAALKECLLTSGLLDRQQYLATLHRHHFTAVMREHPLPRQADISLSQILSTHGLALATCSALRLDDLAQLSMASRSVSVLANQVATMRASQMSLYFLGGCSAGEDDRQLAPEAFDPIVGKWSPLPPPSLPRYNAVAAVLKGRVYICGGRASDEDLGSVERFNPKLREWESLPSMTQPRHHSAAAVLQGCLYVCGGVRFEEHFDLMAGGPSMYDEHLNCVERFDPDTAQWEVVASMVSTRSSAAAVALGDALYVYGGISDEGLLPSAERYSISSRCWEELPAMSRNREYAACNIIMHCDTPGLAAANGCLYVCGGQDKGEVLRSVERFKAETFAWEPVSSMQQARCNAATVSVNGYLYVCGGFDGSRALSTVERLHVGSGHWETVVPMHFRRDFGSVVALGSCVYVLGGWDGTSFIQSVERLNVLCSEASEDPWEVLPSVKMQCTWPLVVAA